ncbi:AbrB/MazE/SpoVT family DNA-binding domain-containing protein [Companilactobacillus sp. HBUAS56257]|uniref:AbrB/MazE/SpoVT family DNA-binding domain-containing protein n=1 Tax=Companilactobacillus sp. HBUAS56257 TaxID=3109360 RepID=UPI002FF3BF59
MKQIATASNVKARKQGNSITLTVPASFGVVPDAIYKPVLKSDGTIVYKPNKNKNLFDTDFNFREAMREMNIKDNGNLVGKENVW